MDFGIGLCVFLDCVLRCVSIASVSDLQAEWLAFPAEECNRDVILLGTSGGNPVAASLAAKLMKKGVNVIGIVAMSGTPDPEQVCQHCPVHVDLRIHVPFFPFPAPGAPSMQSCHYHWHRGMLLGWVPPGCSGVAVPCSCFVSCSKTYAFLYLTSSRNVLAT